MIDKIIKQFQDEIDNPFRFCADCGEPLQGFGWSHETRTLCGECKQAAVQAVIEESTPTPNDINKMIDENM